MNQMRTLYVHAGAHKTGSTALQHYFSRNKVALEQHGISYATPYDGGELLDGNGARLIRSVLSGDETHVRDALNYHFGNHARALISDENACALPDWSFFLRICSETNIRLRVIFFTRNVDSYVASSYQQKLREGRFIGSLKDFVAAPTDCYHVVEWLRRMESAVPRECLKVVHYEAWADSLDGVFLEELKLDASMFDRSPLEQRVNRGLTEFEQSLIAQAGQAYDETGLPSIREIYSLSLARHLISQFPDLKAKPQLPLEAKALIEERYASDVDWINATFFDDEQVVRLFDDEVGNASNAKSLQEQENAILHAAFLWATGKIRDLCKYQGQEAAAAKLEAARRRTLECEPPMQGLPDDFDPVYYLMFNQDLLGAGVDPYEHFLAYGRAEGRLYNWRQPYRGTPWMRE